MRKVLGLVFLLFSSVAIAQTSGTPSTDPLFLRAKSDPTNPQTNRGAIYTKNISGTTDLFYQDSNGTVTQIAGGGGGGGNVSGTGAVGQVTFWNGTSDISGSSDLLWDGTNGLFDGGFFKVGGLFSSPVSVGGDIENYEFDSNNSSFLGTFGLYRNQNFNNPNLDYVGYGLPSSAFAIVSQSEGLTGGYTLRSFTSDDIKGMYFESNIGSSSALTQPAITFTGGKIDGAGHGTILDAGDIGAQFVFGSGDFSIYGDAHAVLSGPYLKLSQNGTPSVPVLQNQNGKAGLAFTSEAVDIIANNQLTFEFDQAVGASFWKVPANFAIEDMLNNEYLDFGGLGQPTIVKGAQSLWDFKTPVTFDNPVTFTGTTPTDGYLLTADSTQPSAVGWVSPATLNIPSKTASYITVNHEAGLPNSQNLTGTSNQISVTPLGSGSPIVIGTPQNIATTSAPTFASLGIGITPTANLHVVGSDIFSIADNMASVFNITDAANSYLSMDTTTGTEALNFGNATTNQSFNFNGTGQTTFNGLFTANLVDNNATALSITDMGAPLLNFDTTIGDQVVAFGNAVTNPKYQFSGSGVSTFNGPILATSTLTVNTDTTLKRFTHYLIGTSASASTTNLGQTTLQISGTTTIDNFSQGGTPANGDLFNVEFTGGPITVKNQSGGTGNIRLKGIVDKIFNAGDTLGLRWDGAAYRETYAAMFAAQTNLAGSSGTGTLVAGTKTIAANITANSRILVTIKDANPGAGNLTVGVSAPSAGRSVGAPGSFTVQADVAAGTINILDTSTFDWIIIN